MMGGSLEVQSKYELGTTFIARIPSQTESEKDERLTNIEEIGKKDSVSVLVIDDDEDVRDMIQRNLAKHGVTTALAGSAEEGLNLARLLKPSVITLDIMMPKRDGWSVLNEIKSDSELQDIPVVLVSIIDDKETGYALGASDYIVKPIDWDNLINVVKKFADQITDHTALVVEDDSRTREILCRAMLKAGWKVIEAANGREAMEKIENGLPGLVMLDLMMPQMDGFEFMHEFRSRPDTADIPVIVITAKDLTKSDREVLSGRVTQILRKGSYRMEELIFEVRKFLPD